MGYMVKSPCVSDTFQYVLKRFRLAKGLVQEELAERIGVATSFVGQMETGKKCPNINMLFRIAAALEERPSELIKALEQEVQKNNSNLFSGKFNKQK